MTPVFMIGTQRSGSNLLRLMLNQLDELASPHPPHILERMYPLMGIYGDLNNDSNFDTLIDDVCRLVELNPVEWSDFTLDRKLVKLRASERSLMSVYGAIYDLYAESKDANLWCCKSLANINYVDDIENYFNHPKYIYLYRDGRDVALSFQKAVVGEKHIYHIAKDWAETQKIAVDLRNHISDDYFFSVSYEQLTQESEETARKLCQFLNVDYTEKMLDFHKSNEAANAAKSSELWSNVSSPIKSNNSKKYKTEMSERDLRIFESVAGEMLDALGYERDLVMPGNETKFTSQDIQLFDELNSMKKFDVLSNVDQEDKKRREKQSQLLTEIRSRTVA